MVKNYGLLCDNVVSHPVFHGLEKDVTKLRALLSDDVKDSTLYNYLVTLKKYVEFVKRKGIEEPLRFNGMLAREFLQHYKPTSRCSQAIRLRKMFHLNGEATDLKVRRVNNPLPEVLTEEEANRIFKGTTSLKWRTIFRLTYEGAMRKHEVLGLKIKHVKFDKFGAEVFIPSTKSESLWLRVIDSAPLLQIWFEQHPDKENREAYVFPGCVDGEPLTSASYWFRLKEIAERVGVKKRVFPHLLRHSRISWLKKHGAKIGISDSVICKLYGRWSGRNAHVMLDRYGRIDPSEANELVLKAYGKLGREEIRESLSKPRSCPRCHVENDSLSKYCRVCGMVLDEKEAILVMEREKRVERWDVVEKQVKELNERLDRIDKIK